MSPPCELRPSHPWCCCWERWSCPISACANVFLAVWQHWLRWNQLTFCGTNLHRDHLPHLPAPLGVLIPTLPPPLPLPSQPSCHMPRPLRRGGCDPPAPSREAPPPPPPPQPRPAPPRPARRSPAPPLGCGRPGGGRAARSGAARSRAAMMVGVRAARGRGGAGGRAGGGRGRSLTCALCLPPPLLLPSRPPARRVPPAGRQQEGSDDGPDFLSEEDRGVSGARRRSGGTGPGRAGQGARPPAAGGCGLRAAPPSHSSGRRRGAGCPPEPWGRLQRGAGA